MSYLDEEPRYGGSFAALLVGYGASRFLGANLWLPVLVALGGKYAIGRIRPAASNHLRWSLGLLFGHTAWMAIGLIALPEQVLLILPDVVVGLALLAWNLIALSRVPAIVLSVYEVVGLAVNAMVALQVGQWGAAMAALLVHIGLRLGIISYAVMAIRSGFRAPETDLAETEEVFS